MSNRSKSDNKVVYFADWNPDVLSGEILPLTKVGVSSDPEKRIKDLTLPPFGLEVVAKMKTYDDAFLVEEALHESFAEAGYKVNGEWFSLPNNVIGWAERTKTAKKSRILNNDW